MGGGGTVYYYLVHIVNIKILSFLKLHNAPLNRPPVHMAVTQLTSPRFTLDPSSPSSTYLQQPSIINSPGLCVEFYTGQRNPLTSDFYVDCQLTLQQSRGFYLPGSARLDSAMMSHAAESRPTEGGRLSACVYCALDV